MARRSNSKKVVYFSVMAILMVVSLIAVVGRSNYQIMQDASNALQEDNQTDTKIVEGKPVFIPAAAGDDYIDGVTSITYGSHDNPPPDGMGVDGSYPLYHSNLEEGNIGWTNLLTHSTFSSTPQDWSANEISYTSGRFGPTVDGTTGYLQCVDIDTSYCSNIRFVLNIGVYEEGGSITVRVDFYDSTGAWDTIDTYSTGGTSDRTVSSSASEYQHSEFKVRVYYSRISTIGSSFSANNWRVSGYDTRGAFQAVYVFSSVDYDTYASEELWVDFAGSLVTSNENLTFRFSAEDTTPDPEDEIKGSANDDFSVDIHSKLTGPFCYLDIRDVDRTDADHDIWRINRIYIKLTNGVPSNTQTPSCPNLDDTDNMYAKRRDYKFFTYHSDPDGYDHTDHVDLQCWNNARTTMYWSVTFDYDTFTFSELSDPNDYIDLDELGSGVYLDGNTLEVHFEITINWNHPDATNIDLRVSIYDADGASDTDYYEVNWDIETRLEFDQYSLDDGAGIGARGDIGGDVTASGIIEYYGGTVHPLESEIDVYIIQPDVTGSPWEATYATIDGGFDTTVKADDDVGQDNYQFRVVAEGAGASGTNLLYTLFHYAYYADRVNVTLFDSTAFNDRVNVSDSVDIYCHLEYEFDSGNVTDGTVLINGATAIHLGDGIWSITVSESSVTSNLYDSITYSGGTMGLTTVNQNAKSTAVIWDKITVQGYASNYSHVNVSVPVQVNVSLEYEFDGSYVSDGTVDINGYSAEYFGEGIWSITVNQDLVGSLTFDTVSCTGNGYYITYIDQNSQSSTIIWDRIIVLSMYSDDPENRTIIGDSVVISCSLRYEFDNSYVNSGTVTINGEMAAGGTDGIWEIIASSAIVSGISFDTVVFTDGPYDVSLVNQNGKDVTTIWDGIEIYNLGAPSWPLVNEPFEVYFNARLAYDSHPLDGSDTVTIDDEIADWNGTHFVISRSYVTPGDRMFYVNSTSEVSYGITTMVLTQACLVHVTDNPIISDIESDFVPSDSLYDSLLDTSPLWIQWDPANDPTPPSFNVTIMGQDITLWNITSSWSSSVVSSGISTGEHSYQIETGLDYTLDNHTYFIFVVNNGGYSSNATVYVTVRDHTSPTISQPDDITYELGSTGNNITWSLNDVHPGSYDIVGNGTDDILGFDETWTNGELEFEIDTLDLGTHNFTIILRDAFLNEITDTVIVTVEDTTRPEVSHPDDLTFTEGAVDLKISWTATDKAPDTFEIRRNETLIAFGGWEQESEMFQVSLEGLSVGLWFFEINLNDTSGNIVTDEVVVLVLADDTSSTTGTSTPTTTETTTPDSPPNDIMTIVLLSIGGIGAIVVIIIGIIVKKRR